MESKRWLQQFAESTRELWTRHGVRQAVRDNLDKLTKCRTLALGAEIYASDSESKTICHTCKSRFCPDGAEISLATSAALNGIFDIV